MKSISNSLLIAVIIACALPACKPRTNARGLVPQIDFFENAVKGTDDAIKRQLNDRTTFTHEADSCHEVAGIISILCNDPIIETKRLKDRLADGNDGENETLCYNAMIIAGNAARIRKEYEENYKKILYTDTTFAPAWEQDNFGKGTSLAKCVLTLTQTEYSFKQKELAVIKRLTK